MDRLRMNMELMRTALDEAWFDQDSVGVAAGDEVLATVVGQFGSVWGMKRTAMISSVAALQVVMEAIVNDFITADEYLAAELTR